MAERDDDRLGGDSRAFTRRGFGGEYRGPLRRYRDEDQGEDPAEHFRRGGEDVARRLGGADADILRAPNHRGRGPKGYRRSDHRIQEDINDRLTDDPHIDASDVEVSVQDGEVTLTGFVDGRAERRRAEDIAESVSGVVHVQNNLRVRQGQDRGDRDRPPIYEGATSTSALGGLDAGMGSAGVSALSGEATGTPAMGMTGGRSGAPPGVASTTGMGYSAATGTDRTSGTPAGGTDPKDLAQPPQDPGR